MIRNQGSDNFDLGKRNLQLPSIAIGTQHPILPDEVTWDMVELALPRFVGLVGLIGLVGVELLLAASVAHVRPQYGCTPVPSLNFGFLLHRYRSRIKG